ncbi:MAG: 6-phosphogluconolactonase, partial [Arsenicicoccus sp.]
PRGFAVLAGGAYAVVAGEKDTDVALVAIGEDGTLTELGRVETGAGANWVRTLPL